MYGTTFEKEVYSDLYGEHGVLIGGIREGILKLMVSQSLSANSTSSSRYYTRVGHGHVTLSISVLSSSTTLTTTENIAVMAVGQII